MAYKLLLEDGASFALQEDGASRLWLEAAGTLYCVIYPAAASAPSAAQIKAGQQSSGSAATAAGNEPANNVTGEQIFDSLLAGLTASTDYKASFVWSDGVVDSNVVTMATFTTSAGGGVTISANIGAAVALGSQATIAATTTINGNVGQAVGAGLAAAISQTFTVGAGVGQAVAAGLPATLTSQTTITGAIGQAVAAGLTADISTGSTVTISANIGQAVGAGLVATIAQTATIAGGVGQAVATGLQASIAAQTTLAGNVGQAVAAGLVATLTAQATIAGNVGQAIAAGVQASIGGTATISSGIGQAVATGLQATINVTGTVTIDCWVGQAVANGLPCSIDNTPPAPAVVGVSGVPRRPDRWSARIRGRLVVGSREEVVAAIEAAAREDAVQVAEQVDAGTSNRAIRKQARKAAQVSLPATIADVQPRDTAGEALRASQALQASLNKAYLQAFEQAMTARALEVLADDEDDLETIELIMELA